MRSRDSERWKGENGMTILDCSVTGCVYNADHCCHKGHIKVEGTEAERTEETSCGSFKERTEDGVVNAAGGNTKEIDVACDACRCVFNEEKKCSAEHIGIAGGNACRCSETECASFRCES